MSEDKEKAFQVIFRTKGKFLKTKSWEEAITVLETVSSTEGLSQNEIDKIVDFLTSTKLSAGVFFTLLKCLIPNDVISNTSIQNMMKWLICSHSTTPVSIVQKVLRWFTALLHYNLINPSILEPYYMSIIRLMMLQLSLVPYCCPLLCLLTKPDDVKRCIVKMLLKLQSITINRRAFNPLFSMMKSYRPDIVPENFPATSVNYEQCSRAFSKLQEKEGLRDDMDEDLINLWSGYTIFDKKSKSLRRLLPPVSNVNFHSSIDQPNKKSVLELNTISKISQNWFQLSIPAQTMSLLVNNTGYYILSFSDVEVQVRLSYNMFYTLHRVMITQSEPYLKEEKSLLLTKISGLQYYLQQGIPVVSKFLLQYLLMWDGISYQDEILSLMEWFAFNDKELKCWLLWPLKHIYRSSEGKTKRKILNTLTRLIENLMVTRTQFLFLTSHEEYDNFSKIYNIIVFVKRMLAEDLIHSQDRSVRHMIRAGLQFFEAIWDIWNKEEIEKLAIVMAPPSLIYNGFLSNSPICVERVAALLCKYLVYADQYTDEIAINVKAGLMTSVLDFYRCIWTRLDDLPEFRHQSNLLHSKKFLEKLVLFQDSFNIEVDTMLRLDKQMLIFDGFGSGLIPMPEEELLEKLRNYPSILELKSLVYQIL